MMRSPIAIFCLLLVLGACGPRSADDFRHEGRQVGKALTEELKKIRTRAQLTAAQERLTRLFDRLVDLMIRARELQEGHTWEVSDHTDADDSVNAELQAQLRRVSAIDGGLEILEKCQESALERLDRFEQDLVRRRKLR